MFFSVIGTNVRPQIRPRFLLFLAIGAIKLDVLEVQSLHMVRYHVFQVMDLLAEVALPEGSSILSRDLLHVLDDGFLEQI
jgi:hypothetical protein